MSCSGLFSTRITAAVIYMDIIVIGHPRAQSRPRAFRNGGVQTDSDTCAAWKATVIEAILASDIVPVPPGQPLELEIQFAMPTAQRSSVGKHATTRPDADNLFKAASDALMAPSNRSVKHALKAVRGGLAYAGLIADDAAIYDVIIRKRWSAAPSGARLILRDAPAI